MASEFVDVLRHPDYVIGATDDSPYRFEEPEYQSDCPIEYEYLMDENGARIVVYPGKQAVKYLKFRFSGNLSFVNSVYGDQWERSGIGGARLEWKSVMASRVLPWFCYVRGEGRTACYGVKTGANCFAYWQVDTHGITLFLNLTCGNAGTQLRDSIVAAEVVQLFGKEDEAVYSVACKFASMMCERPVLPRTPVFGVNNWYWAYGKISSDSVLRETDYLMEMTKGTKHRPYIVIDDGWQINRTFEAFPYIGGPWIPNEKFKDMKQIADAIHDKGANAGIWFRPLLTMGEIPEQARMASSGGGQIMDPSHPYTLDRIRTDVSHFLEWGYDLIKHDFSTMDITGNFMNAETHGPMLCSEDRVFYDQTRTTAMIIKDFYQAIQMEAKQAEVIGCNCIGHLSAGIHSIQRVGGDTSGHVFEWTIRQGVNSMMRLPLNGKFYLADPDCAVFTEKVPVNQNLNYLEMCALTGVTTFASVKPGILKSEEMERIRNIFHLADRGNEPYQICNYEKTALPEIFVSGDGKTEKEFNWEETYYGSRSVLDWYD